MISRRRLTFQLTPLLDLLLIVIFAQFMDTQETTARIEKRAATEVQQAEKKVEKYSVDSESAHQEVKKLSELHLKALRDAVKTKDMFVELENRTRRMQQSFKKENRELSEQLKRVKQQRDRVAELTQQIFQIPDQTLDPVLKSKVDSNTENTQADLERIKKQLRELAAARSEDVVKHFLTYDELTKRSDIWELYLTENGVFRLTIGKQITEFRADSTQDFVDRFYAIYKTVPQPKSLVIILFSYGDAKASVRFAATQGLPFIAERMRADSNGRTRFEYAVMGFAPEKRDASSINR